MWGCAALAQLAPGLPALSTPAVRIQAQALTPVTRREAGPGLIARQYGDASLLVKTPARAQVWQVAGGRRRWIADLATFQARGYRWNDVGLMAPAVLRAIPPGPADHDGALLRDPARGDIYLVVDKQAHRVPDLVTFAAYGLTWDRVASATVTPATITPATVTPTTTAAGSTSPAIGGIPIGDPLPHAVTGGTLIRPPTRLPPPASLAGTAAPGLRAALELMETYPPTAGWPAFLERFGVTLRFDQAAAGIASYRAAGRTLLVRDEYATLRPATLATLLAHETVHAIRDAAGTSGKSGRNCIDEEVEAFGVQSAFWAHLNGLQGKPAPENTVERELNLILQASLDDALTGAVISTFAYTLQCYFPSLGSDSD